MNKQVIQIRIKKDGSYTLEAKEGFAGDNALPEESRRSDSDYDVDRWHPRTLQPGT